MSNRVRFVAEFDVYSRNSSNLEWRSLDNLIVRVVHCSEQFKHGHL